MGIFNKKITIEQMLESLEMYMIFYSFPGSEKYRLEKEFDMDFPKIKEFDYETLEKIKEIYNELDYDAPFMDEE
jgi:hypothetical protein